MTKKKQSFEDNIIAVNKIIEQLEKGDLSLEASMSEYKKGFELLHDSRMLLANAESEFAALLAQIEEQEETDE